MTWSPGLDPLLIAALTTGLIALIAREFRGGATAARALRAAARVVAVGALALVLANPGSRHAAEEPAPPKAALLVDRSRSMAVIGADRCTRLAAFQRAWLSQEGIERLRAACDLSVVAAAERAEPISPDAAPHLEPDGALSRLHAAAAGLLARSRGAHLVLLTDGADTDGRSLAELAPAAREAGTRVHVVLAEEAAAPSDLAVEASFDRPWAASGDAVLLRVDIRQRGFTGRQARLTVRQGGPESPTTRIVAEREVVLSERQRVEVELRPEAEVAPGGVALARFEASIEPFAAEADRGNNAAPALIQVVPKRMKVVLFEAEPTWDARFFAASLEGEDDIDLTTVLEVRAGANGVLVVRTNASFGVGAARQVGAGAPRTQDELDAFDVIVLGRGSASMLGEGAEDRLRRFVEERGGALLFLRGPSGPAASAGPIDSLSPMRWAGGAARIDRPMLRDAAEDGRLLSGGATLREVVYHHGRLALAATVLGEMIGVGHGPEDSPMPIIAEMPLGRGRAAAVSAEGLWRIVFASPEWNEAARRLWAGLVRRLAWGGESPPGARASILFDRVAVQPGEAVGVQVRAREHDLDLRVLVVATPDGQSAAVPLVRDDRAAGAARWTAMIRPKAEGEHVVRLELPPAESGEAPAMIESAFVAKASDVESAETAVRRDDLSALAAATGGRVFDADGLGEFLRHLTDERAAMRRPSRIEPLWDRPWMFAAIVGLLIGEWWLRRRGGLA